MAVRHGWTRGFGNEWPQAKRHVFENMLVYCGMLILDCGLDFIINGLNALKGIRTDSGHPYSIGAIQIAVFTFAAIQLARHLNQWKYYGKYPWQASNGYRFERDS